MPKTSSIRSAVSIEHRLVTDRHRQTRTQAHGEYRGCIASRGKNDSESCWVPAVHRRNRRMGRVPSQLLLSLVSTLFNGCTSSTVCETRSSAIAEGLRDASCQLKSCQLPHNSAETTYTTSADQIDGISWRFSWRQCVIDNVHSTMTRPSRLPLSQVS